MTATTATAAASGDAALTIDDIIGDIHLPERTYRLCRRADLRAQWEDLDRKVRIAEREMALSDSLAGTSEQARELARQCRDLEEQMEKATVPIHLRALPNKAYSDLVAKHPPDKDAKDGANVNSETFGPALLAACAVQPVMTEEQAGLLVDRLSSGQWSELFDMCWQLNQQQKVDVPKSRSASEILRSTPTS